jgi:hypothetical protein
MYSAASRTWRDEEWPSEPARARRFTGRPSAGRGGVLPTGESPAEHARGRHVIKPASGPLRAMDPGLPSIRAVPTAGSVCPLLAPFRRGGAVE